MSVSNISKYVAGRIAKRPRNGRNDGTTGAGGVVITVEGGEGGVNNHSQLSGIASAGDEGLPEGRRDVHVNGTLAKLLATINAARLDSWDSKIGPQDTAYDAARLGGRAAADYWNRDNANRSTISWEMAQALVYDKISFSKYGNAEGGWDGASIRHDNEGNTDASKLIFELTDDPNDWFEWRIWQAYNTRFNTPLCVKYDYSYFNGKLGVNTNNPTDALSVIGNTRTSGTYYGNNLEITENITAKTGEFDELTVNGPLNVHELVANQTRVTNGDLWIQNNCKIASIYKDSETEFIFATDTASLRVDDLCIIQVQRASGLVHRLAFKVIAYNDSLTVPYRGLLISGDVVDANSWDLFFAGDLIVQVGNTSIKARQSSVLNCVSFGGYGAATLYYANVDTIPVGNFYPGTDKITSAIGDLRGLGLGSAAVYTTDGNFKGTIQADSGRINGCMHVGNDNLVGITGRNVGQDPTFQPAFFAGISESEAYHAIEGDYGGFEEIPFSVIGKRGSSIFSIAKMRRCTSEDMYVTGRYRRMTNPIQWDSQGIFLYGNRIGTDTLNMSLSSDYSVVIHNAANTMGGIYINEPTDIANASGTVITLHVFNYDRGIHTIQPKVKLKNLTISQISNLPVFTLSQFESCAYTIKYARELTEIGLSGWVVLSAQKFTKL